MKHISVFRFYASLQIQNLRPTTGSRHIRSAKEIILKVDVFGRNSK